MEFNLNLSTSVSDIIGYFQGNINNTSDELNEGVFDNILDKSFCDSDESEDIDYNLILNLLNNLKLFNNEENYNDTNKVYTELEQVDSGKFSKLESINTIDKFNFIRSDTLDNIYKNINDVSLNIKTNSYEVEQNLLSSEEAEVLNKVDDIICENKMESSNTLDNIHNDINEIDLNIKTNNHEVEQNLLSSEELEILSKLKNEYEILSNNITKMEVSDKEIEVLKKFDYIMSDNKIEKNDELFKVNKFYNDKLDKNENTFKNNLVDSEKFSQLENSNIVDKLNLIRSDDLDKSDNELNALKNIVNVESNNNFILSNNQLVNKDLNSMNTTPTLETTTIRQEYIEEDVIKTVKYLKSSGQETITLKISPKELGDMTIKFTNNQDESSVVITINNSDVFDLVNDNQSEIVKHLKDLNINIKEISIEMKDNTQNNFSSNLSQEFARNHHGSKDGNKKNISSTDEEVDDEEEFYVEENINILI